LEVQDLVSGKSSLLIHSCLFCSVFTWQKRSERVLWVSFIRALVLGAPEWLGCWASAFGSGRGPGVLGSSPTSGSLLGRKPASPSPTLLVCVPSLSVSVKK